MGDLRVICGVLLRLVIHSTVSYPSVQDSAEAVEAPDKKKRKKGVSRKKDARWWASRANSTRRHWSHTETGKSTQVGYTPSHAPCQTQCGLAGADWPCLELGLQCFDVAGLLVVGDEASKKEV